ncbi:hypothetical protein GQ600_18131 [Phytophthora cactorum]|nr:hypothetical protein GQ600_18131 [Phytophthora cactorum]
MSTIQGCGLSQVLNLAANTL